jgi:hypothetical protein
MENKLTWQEIDEKEQEIKKICVENNISIISGPIEFNTHQPMVCGSYEAERRKYKMYIGKSGKRWLIADQKNCGENIYIDGGKGSKGFGGRTLTFELIDGTKVDFIGPWATNADHLLADTGIDNRDKIYTKGIISLEKEYSEYDKPEIHRNILHVDDDYVLGYFHRLDDLAQNFANKLNKKVYVSYIHMEGGYGGWQDPKIKKESQNVK